MTLPRVEATPEVIGGWIVHCNSCYGWSTRAGALTAALENMGPEGYLRMLDKMKLTDTLKLTEWLAKK